MVNLGRPSEVFNTQCPLIYNKRGKWMCVARQEMKMLSWVWDLKSLQTNLPQTQLVSSIMNSNGPQYPH